MVLFYDAEEQVKREMLRAAQTTEQKLIKDELREKGLTHQLSFYGAAEMPHSDQVAYRRIEIFCDRFPTEADFYFLYGFFRQLIPESTYTIWSYLAGTAELELIKEFN